MTMVPVYYDRRPKVVFNCLSNFTVLERDYGIRINPSYLPLQYLSNVTEFNFARDTFYSPSKTARYSIHVCFPQDETAFASQVKTVAGPERDSRMGVRLEAKVPWQRVEDAQGNANRLVTLKTQLAGVCTDLSACVATDETAYNQINSAYEVWLK